MPIDSENCHDETIAPNISIDQIKPSFDKNSKFKNVDRPLESVRILDILPNYKADNYKTVKTLNRKALTLANK